MKATARKLLALIMAMAMCLSLLQGVAFAAESSEAEAEAEVVEVVADEAKEEKKEEVKEQDGDVLTVSIIELNSARDGFKVTLSNSTSYEYKWSASSYGDYVEVTKVDYGTKRVGEYKQYRYTVKAKAAYVAAGKSAPTFERVVDDKDVHYSLKDSDIEWATLTNEQDWFTAGGKDYQVKGSIYQEQQADGKWTVYGKLSPLTSDGKAFDTSSSAKPVYVKVTGLSSRRSTDKQIRNAMSSATSCDEYGAVTSKPLPYLEMKGEADTSKTYSYSVISWNDNVAVTDAIAVTFKGLATTGEFTVRVTYDANEHKTPHTVDDIQPESDADSVKTALNKIGKDAWKVTNITKEGENFKVAIEKITAGTGEADDLYYGDSNNTTYYIVNGHLKAGLVDLNADGAYYATNADSVDDKKTTIKAGTKVYGEVAVKASDMPEDVTGYGTKAADGYYYFASEAAMKKDLKNTNCGKTQTIKFVKLVRNEKNGSKTNYTASEDWAANKDAFIEQGTDWVMEKNSEHTYRVVEDVTPATCAATGSKVTKTVCKVCGAEKDSKTETLPMDKTSVETRSKTKGEYQFYKNDGTLIAGAPATAHYIKEEVITTTLATQESKGSIKHEYKCNYGVVHSEYTWTEETDKKALEYSGRWDNVAWTAQNTANARNPEYLYGYGLYIFDTDFTTPTLPLNDQKLYNCFDLTGFWVVAKTDGTYFRDFGTTLAVDVATKASDGSKKVENTQYDTTVTVKDIKNGAKECQDGSATIEINVYKVTSSFGGWSNAEDVAADVKANRATLVNTITKTVTVPANKTHVDANNDGICDNCGDKIRETPEPEDEKKISDCTITVSKLTWTGKKAQPKVTVTDKTGAKLAKGIDYEVEDFEETAAGKYELVIAGLSSWTGRTTAEVEIAKASQTIKATPATKTVTAKSVKKKAATFTIKVTGKKNGAKLTYKSSNTKIATVSAAGKVTIKKGAKKGKAVITVQAKATKNVKASKAVKVTVTVK